MQFSIVAVATCYNFASINKEIQESKYCNCYCTDGLFKFNLESLDIIKMLIVYLKQINL